MIRALAFLLLLLGALIQAAVVPLNLDGALEEAIADSDAYNTGGKIKVNGVTVTIPKNTQIQFPAAFVPFKDITDGRFRGYEVSVTGNVVDGNPIAGLVALSQFGLSGTTGVVTGVSFNGAIQLDTGVTLRINDPNAVYSAGYDGLKEFTADDENPSVTAYSGFPMCVPRSSNDEKCPSANRPQGQRRYVAQLPDLMAPIVPGDYIECSGVRTGSEVLCYNLIVANVHIMTRGIPPYIRMEDGLIGVVDDTDPNNVEFADVRFIGHTSDADNAYPVTISRTEIDPCTGEPTDISIGVAQPVGDRGKFVYRTESSVRVNYARDYHITTGGTRSTYDGQIVAGQYVQPVGEWIFPEIINPPDLSSADFRSFTWLAKGFGPDEDGNIWGPLSPWPDTRLPPTPPACDPATPPASTTAPPSTTTTGASGPGGVATPTVNAGTDQAVRPGVRMDLKAAVSNSAAFGTGDLKYSWAQTAGDTVTISGANTANAFFIAPQTTTLKSYTFELTVTSTAKSTSAKDSVIVSNDPSKNDEVVIDSYSWGTRQGGTIAVTAHTNVVDGSAQLSLILNNPNAGAPLAMTSSGGGKFTYSSRSTKIPSNGITVRSNRGGSVDRTTLTARKQRRHPQLASPLENVD